MAIENDDLLVLQKNGGGGLRKATVGALLADAVTATPNLDEVTTEGGTTSNNISVGQLESTSIGCSGGITSDITVTAGAGDTLIQLNGTSGEISGGALAFIDGGEYAT